MNTFYLFAVVAIVAANVCEATWPIQVPSAKYLNMTTMGSFVAHTHSFVISSGKNFTTSYIANDIANKVFVTSSDDAKTVYTHNGTYITFPPSVGGDCFFVNYTYDELMGHLSVHFKEYGIGVNLDNGIKTVHQYMGQAGEKEVCYSGHYALLINIEEPHHGDFDELVTWQFSTYISIPLTSAFGLAMNCSESVYWGRYDGKIKHIVTEIDPATDPSFFAVPSQCITDLQTYEDYCCMFGHATSFDIPDGAF
jgi:hypothetical protein